MAGKRAKAAQAERTRSLSTSHEVMAVTPARVHTKKKNSRWRASIQRRGGWLMSPSDGTIIGQVWTMLARCGKLRV
jgi:hypothetical protein